MAVFCRINTFLDKDRHYAITQNQEWTRYAKEATRADWMVGRKEESSVEILCMNAEA